MHRALQIAEIVDLICSQIALQSLHPGPSGDLAALARTSKVFLDPALNGLWRYQDTFLPILQCMPDDLWGGPVVNVVDFLNIARSIVPGDWDRPLFYLHREPASQDLFDTFSLCFPTEHFFPNLRSLEWVTNVNSALFHSIRLLLGPEITDLQITFSDSIPCLSFIPMIAAKYPDLRSAYLRCGDFGSQTRDCISLFARGLKCIETLSVNDLDVSAFAHLSTLPTFKSLTVTTLRHFSPCSSASSEPDIPRFIGLTTLDITATTDKAAIFCIKALSQSPLATVSLCMKFPTTPNFVSLLYSSVAENISHATLRSLDIKATDDIHWPERPPSSPERPAIFRTALRQLFCFGGLTRAKLTTTGGFYLNDSLLEQPRKPRHLRWLAVFGLPVSALVTIGLELETSVIPFPDYSYGDRKFPSRLSDLRVGYSPIFEPSLVACFLAATFPEIRKISANYEVDSEWERNSLLYGGRWIEINKITELLLVSKLPLRGAVSGIRAFQYIHGVLALAINFTFKRVEGDMDEWEVVGFSECFKMRIPFASFYCNRKTTDTFKQLFTELFDAIYHVTGEKLLRPFYPDANCRIFVMGGEYNSPTISGISENNSIGYILYCLKTCIVHFNRCLDELNRADVSVIAQLKKIIGYKTQEDVGKRHAYCQSVATVYVAVNGTGTSQAVVPLSINPFLFKIAAADYVITPNTTNLAESAHAGTNTQRSTKPVTRYPSVRI
ncbi:hypothetical protein GGX14DRAFT_633250 [Mycena pura]|uniref:F-box domain-containing protein n=1 Tax=Mycena pura TaxID=153505 RepID=A0AAD6YGD9_9AGAR|nr:hypothetical protein GGX14DRAFT_633250 [Mycena pura]